MKFKLETEFQETEIGKIPRKWKVVYLSELFEFHRGLSYRKNNLSPTQTSIRFVTINDLKKEGGWKREGESAYLAEGFKDKIEKKHVLKVGDLLIAITDMGKGFIIGAPLYINEDIRSQGETLVYSMDLVKLQPKKQVNTLFYFYQLSWSKIREIMKSLARGTNVLHLDLNLAQRIKLVEPPLNEQVRIAEIVSTVDRAIEVVDAGVVRLEGLKKALMRELLTGRIRVREENGKPVFHRETEFQDTEIGKIPKEWKIYSIEEIFDLYKGTTPSTKEDKYWGGDIPFVTPTDITALNEMNKIYLSTTEKYLTEEGRRSKSLRLIPRGSLLFTSRATIGYLAVNNVEVAINQGIIALIPKIKDLDVIYYYYYLTSVRKKLEELAGGSTYKEISMNTFRKLMIPHPPLEEQRKIAEILSTVNRAIELYREERVRLDRLKRGLMDLLLTGKIRVVED